MWKEFDLPYKHVCEIDKDTHLCKHCLRSLDEIDSWLYFNENDKREVYKAIEKRKSILKEFEDKTPPVLEWVI
ncbi:MAG: hypothetical protein A2V66_02785 [Ignavibacteria bacterium RBG_13_36_8]|nr:MAG: hypothetical protein A2V66_02785 [Ignavibacteria bacterium RBG_13_36_8]